MSDSIRDRRRAERSDLEASIKFSVDSDIMEGATVNVSDTGIQFKSKHPIRIIMRYEKDGKEVQRVGELCWARRENDESFSYGFAYGLKDA